MDERMEKLEGHVMATQAAIRALIKLAPDINGVALAVQQEIDIVIDAGLPFAVSEAFLDGIAQSKDRILPSAKEKAGRGQ